MKYRITGRTRQRYRPLKTSRDLLTLIEIMAMRITICSRRLKMVMSKLLLTTCLTIASKQNPSISKTTSRSSWRTSTYKILRLSVAKFKAEKPRRKTVPQMEAKSSQRWIVIWVVRLISCSARKTMSCRISNYNRNWRKKMTFKRVMLSLFLIKKWISVPLKSIDRPRQPL